LKSLSPLEKQRGELLAYFLNRDLDENREIGEILQSCQELHALYTKRPAPLQTPERMAYQAKELSLVGRIGQLLCGFEIVLGVEVSELGISTVWRLARPISSKNKAVIAQFTKTGARTFNPVQVILEMTASGIVDRIRRCENPNCRKWIMVTSTKRVTCSDACRFEKFKMQPRSRANDMRRSRETHKNHPQLKRQKGRKTHERKG
jgi:hypothetical protein